MQKFGIRDAGSTDKQSFCEYIAGLKSESIYDDSDTNSKKQAFDRDITVPTPNYNNYYNQWPFDPGIAAGSDKMRSEISER